MQFLRKMKSNGLREDEPVAEAGPPSANTSSKMQQTTLAFLASIADLPMIRYNPRCTLGMKSSYFVTL